MPVCPTYTLTGMERSSPRGRIRLIKEVAAGHLEISKTFIEEMYFCLDCQACVTVCPAGVKYGQLVEAARSQIFESGKERGLWLKKFFFRSVFTSFGRLKLLARFVRFYQKIIEPLLHKSGIYKLLPRRIRSMQELAPRISARFFDDYIPERSMPQDQVRYRVGMLTGCLMNIMFADINADTVEVLQVNDCEVITPKSQVCCGSLAAHNGDFEIAKTLARQNIDIFFNLKLDAIVINSAGCSAFMKEYGQLLANDIEYSEKAAKISEITLDVSEFLLKHKFKKPSHPFARRVTYHDACHLIHTQGISQQPRQLLELIPGVVLIELDEASWCCGSAGIYNLTRYEDSMRILDRKIENIKKTGADIVVTGNPGCMGQLSYGLRRANLAIQVLHPITLLNQAYKNSQSQ
ncbi:MAG: (Fe-S)-binding protein [bacterium]|nr:MAG: (Fe-S)-binding protein [bacterium]